MEVPSKTLLSVEVFRSIYEYGLGWLLNVPLQFICPEGDNHPIMVIPGLGTADTSTYFIRNFLNNIGYDAHSWGLGRNLGPRNGFDALLKQLSDRVDFILSQNGAEELSIIGWSLGGIYAREIAKLIPGKIRQVISMGSPFKVYAGGTHATLLYELLSKDKSYKEPEIMKRISTPPPVPFTSIYSKTDGVVHWECCIEDRNFQCENIEIPGASHLGLGHNPISMYIIANRLIQTKSNWVPYKK
jgi:hypothetical protein